MSVHERTDFATNAGEQDVPVSRMPPSQILPLGRT